VTRVFGTKGTLEIRDAVLTASPQDTRPRPEGYSIHAWPEKLRNEYLADRHKQHPEPEPGAWQVDASAPSFQPSPGYSKQNDHRNNFTESVRACKSSVEDAVFGNHTAIACHTANYSYFHKTVVTWDEGNHKIVG
jgi:hypothetical protein